RIALLFLATLVLLSSSSVFLLAAVTGDCVNCHTMHNSQDGNTVVDTSDNSNVAQMNLLTSDCLGCHTNPNGNQTILNIGTGNTSRVPIVFTASAPTYPPDGSTSSALAGGNFYWVAKEGDQFGHNVYGLRGGINEADSNLRVAPGGFSCMGDCHATLATPTSGCRGCHFPAHHADDGDPNDAVDSGDGWYRFLSGVTMLTNRNTVQSLREELLAQPAVSGIEDPDWEQNPNAHHNVYKGTTTAYQHAEGEDMYPGSVADNSIGAYCSGCHSNFHHENGYAEPGGGMGSPGAWIRHPSDVVIPNEREYAYATTYDPLAPVALTNLGAGSIYGTEVNVGSDVVTCISCHRPHGSPYPDMLRWDYMNDCNTGVAATVENPCGCFSCHTGKD
uniref:cytochrome c3 family protein n=1 Tax=Malonomonas rubra TaxID=57040 RepID=UPI0026EB6EDF